MLGEEGVVDDKGDGVTMMGTPIFLDKGLIPDPPTSVELLEEGLEVDCTGAELERMNDESGIAGLPLAKGEP